MPELPEVETVMRGLAPVMEGQVVTDVWLGEKGLRYPFPGDLAVRLTGQKIIKLSRRAKYLLCDLSSNRTLILHLGMSGRVRIQAPGSNQPSEIHDHFKLSLEDGHSIILNDARRFGMVLDDESANIPINKFIKYLGPEPFSQEFNPDYLINTIKNKRIAIKVALMDQKTVVGVGNIYASEALYRARISPLRSAATLTKPEAKRLVAAIQEVLADAIAAGGSTLRDHRTAYGDFGYFQQKLSVYAREKLACPACTCDIAKTGGVHKIVQGGRATYFCPKLQG